MVLGLFWHRFSAPEIKFSGKSIHSTLKIPVFGGVSNIPTPKKITRKVTTGQNSARNGCGDIQIGRKPYFPVKKTLFSGL